MRSGVPALIRAFSSKTNAVDDTSESLDGWADGFDIEGAEPQQKAVPELRIALVECV